MRMRVMMVMMMMMMRMMNDDDVHDSDDDDDDDDDEDTLRNLYTQVSGPSRWFACSDVCCSCFLIFRAG